MVVVVVGEQGVGREGGWYADTAGCQQATGKWMPEKAITMINLLLRFSE